MKKTLKILLVLFIVVLVPAAWVGFETWSFVHTASDNENREVFLDVPAGASLARIASSLEEKGLITNARKFQWLARYENKDSRLQAGRFRLNSSWTPVQILNELATGKPVLYRITIPEGLTWWQTGKLLADAGFVRNEDFSKLVKDPEFLRHYGIPFSTAEGFLMPDTYLLKKPDSPPPGPDFSPATEEEQKIAEQWSAQTRAVAGRLIDNFWQKAASVWPAQHNTSEKMAKPARDDLKKWVILASIVEKETGNPEERGRVAGVYANRLKKGMLLQADPTIIYGLGPDFQGAILRSQIADARNSYNTYQHPGLPPGPISSFGISALKAAISPEHHDYLYFVASKDGGEHVFSTNLQDHNRAAQEYRRQKRN